MLTETWQQEGGVGVGYFHFFFYRCCGWCSLPLHHQMVRQQWQEQQITYWVLCQYKSKEESPDCTAIRFGDSFLRQRGLSFLFAYRHYNICRNVFQYTFFISYPYFCSIFLFDILLYLFIRNNRFNMYTLIFKTYLSIHQQR